MSETEFDFETEIEQPLRDDKLTRVGRLVNAARYFRDAVHPTNKQAAEGYLISQFLPEAIACLSRDASIDHVMADLARKTNELRPGPRVLTAQDQVSAISDVLTKMGWSPLEMDLVIRELKVGEAIIGYDARAMHTDAPRTISRRELREKYRPVNWTNLASWDAQFRAYAIGEESPAAEIADD